MCMCVCVCVCVCVWFFFSLTVYLILVINITTSRCVPQWKPNINPGFSHYQYNLKVLTNNAHHELNNSIEGTPLLQSSVRLPCIKSTPSESDNDAQFTKLDYISYKYNIKIIVTFAFVLL